MKDYKEFLKAVKSKDLRLSFTSLNKLQKSPRHFLEHYTKEFKPSQSMVFGSLVHCLVLEPETFEQRYIISPTFDKRTKAGKQGYKDFLTLSEGLEVVSEKEYKEALFAIEGLKSCKPALELLRDATETEKKIRFKYKGLTISGIVDGLNPNFRFDLKTTQDASPKNFKWSVRKYCYHLQAAIYTYENKEPFYIIALEKSGNCAVYELSENLINSGRVLFEDLITKYKKCSFLECWNQSYSFSAPDGVHILE